ncbi:MAG TPA: hypothetical protein VK892_06410, partial [Pyrinomonadaceae bacterium]|nr:hypothetical protein [Pyrinomonadaceae bacterium]
SESKAQIAAPAAIEYSGLNISPDGNQLYYINEKGALLQMPVLGGAVKKITDGLFVRNIANGIGVSPDGKQIAFVRRFEKEVTALFIADADGRSEYTLATFEQPFRLYSFPAWSPDGKTIACPVWIAGKQNILAVQVADGTSVPILPKGSTFVREIAWLPDSKSLLMIGEKEGDLSLEQPWQISYPGGEVRLISNDTNEYAGISLKADGSLLTTVRVEQAAHIWTMPADDARRAQQLTTGFEKFDGVVGLGWLSDSKVFYGSTPSGKSSVWAIRADGSNSIQLVKGSPFSAASPDGRFVIYQKGKPETNDIGLYQTDISDGSEKRLTKGIDIWATFSPDGKWIVFTRFGERVGLWKVGVEGGEPTRILDKNAVCPAVSPDGETIAFILRQGGQPNRIALVSSDGGERIKTFDAKLEIFPTSDNQKLQWAPDGQGIYFIAFNNGVSNIWRQPIDGSPPVQVTDFKDGRIFNFAFSPDGSQLALSRGTFNSDVVLIENAN